MATNAEALIQAEELTAVLEAREFAYQLLMQAFLAEPSREWLDALAETGAAGAFPFAGVDDQIAQGAAATERYLSNADNRSDEGFDRLTWDFTRLFIGPDKLPAPPYESAYRSEDRLLFQAETLAVRQCYLKYGYLPAKQGAEPDDQMGLELCFLHETCRLAIEQTKTGDAAHLVRILQDQSAFLDEHLLTWAPAFARDVVVHASTEYYRGMALLLAGFLRTDRTLLTELLQEASV